MPRKEKQVVAEPEQTVIRFPSTQSSYSLGLRIRHWPSPRNSSALASWNHADICRNILMYLSFITIEDSSLREAVGQTFEFFQDAKRRSWYSTKLGRWPTDT